MPNDTKRGIGAVLVAMGAIGLLLWLAVARLSPETALGPLGLLILVAVIGAGLLGLWLVRKNR